MPAGCKLAWARHHAVVLQCCVILQIAGDALCVRPQPWGAETSLCHACKFTSKAYTCNQEVAMQVLEGIVSIVGASTGLQAPLMSAGMDSLGAVELHRELCRWV